MTPTSKIQREYNRAKEAFKVASAAVDSATYKYRAHEIGEAEYLIAKTNWKIADKALDLAAQEYLDSVGE